jgi:hypothetical protein
MLDDRLIIDMGYMKLFEEKNRSGCRKKETHFGAMYDTVVGGASNRSDNMQYWRKGV